MELALEKIETPVLALRASKETGVAFLYLVEQGSILRKAGDRLLIEKDDELLLDLPYHKLETVLLFGNVQVTTQAMGELLEKGVGLSLFSRQGMYRGSLSPPRGKNVDLRIAQFEAFRDHQRALDIARRIVAAKLENSLAVLDLQRRHNPAPATFDEGRTALESAVSKCAAAEDVAALDGVEGAAARRYFELLMSFHKSEMVWPGRIKHPATDPLNALLSLTYTLLMNELSALLEGVGLDPYLGFLHQPDFGRPSLALDLVEAFRSAVAGPAGPATGEQAHPGSCGFRFGRSGARCVSRSQSDETLFRGVRAVDGDQAGGWDELSRELAGRGGKAVGRAPQPATVRALEIQTGNGGSVQYVICYDITEDRRRNRVAAILLDFGQRVQESVFVAHLDDDLASRMRTRLQSAIDEDWDKVHVFEVCAACEKRQWTLGEGKLVEDPPWYVV
jgi:CRISPR-associated protein Cas1